MITITLAILGVLFLGYAILLLWRRRIESTKPMTMQQDLLVQALGGDATFVAILGVLALCGSAFFR